MITQSRLQELIKYNQDTGQFSWRIGRKGTNSGKLAGSLNHRGYVQIAVDSKRYYAHRLAWLYVYGYMPENHIDHINRDRSDNRIENLREVTQQCNLRNTGNRESNTSGIKGVCWHSKANKWMSHIGVNGKLKYLGCHEDFTEAVAHRLAAEQCLDWEGCNLSSPSHKYINNYLKGEI